MSATLRQNNNTTSSSKLTVELEETKRLIQNNDKPTSTSYTNPSQLQSSDFSTQISTNELTVVLLGAAAGNFLEWFNFAIFGLLANILGELFFPVSNPIIHLFQIYILLALVFMMRPIGGIIFGMLGDKYGRLYSLKISITLMAGTTLITAVLPTYNTIGIFSTIMMITIRLIQGLSVGGELTGCMIYVVEICPQQHRSLFACLVQITGFGTLIASAIMAALNTLLTHEQILEYGWRIPYILGSIIGVFGIWTRFYLTHDSPVFIKAQRQGTLVRYPLKQAFKTSKYRIIAVCFHVLFMAFGYYIYFIWFPIYFTVINTFTFNSFAVNIVAMFICALSALFTCYLMDYYHLKSSKVLIPCCFIQIILCVIFFPFLNNSNDNFLSIIIWLLLSLSFGLYYGSTQIWMIDIFPDISCRYSAFGFGYNIATAILGGTSALIATSVVEIFDNGMVSLGWIMFLVGSITMINDIIATYFHNKTSINNQAY